MTVYVDPIRKYGKKGHWCHMMTDGDLEELHQMARFLGLRQEYFQDHPLHPHYDLSPRKRFLAVKHKGVVEVTAQEMARKCSKLFK